MMERVTQEQLVRLFGSHYDEVMRQYQAWGDLRQWRQFTTFEQWWEGALTYQDRQRFLSP